MDKNDVADILLQRAKLTLESVVRNGRDNAPSVTQGLLEDICAHLAPPLDPDVRAKAVYGVFRASCPGYWWVWSEATEEMKTSMRAIADWSVEHTKATRVGAFQEAGTMLRNCGYGEAACLLDDILSAQAEATNAQQ